eukprot:RCo051245
MDPEQLPAVAEPPPQPPVPEQTSLGPALDDAMAVPMSNGIARAVEEAKRFTSDSSGGGDFGGQPRDQITVNEPSGVSAIPIQVTPPVMAGMSSPGFPASFPSNAQAAPQLAPSDAQASLLEPDRLCSNARTPLQSDQRGHSELFPASPGEPNHDLCHSKHSG